MDPNLRTFVDKRVGPVWDFLKLGALAASLHINRIIEVSALRAAQQRIAMANAGMDVGPASTIYPVPPAAEPAPQPSRVLVTPAPAAPRAPAAAPVIPPVVLNGRRVEPSAQQVSALKDVFKGMP